ncbi:DNA polymerase sliding clamp [Halomarina litorea]|uniref:DNA polymerase sliding clamp n=1 Tax=Halomarina litorea TaxID=2961595 RepID=UPI0020C5A338|nr:DNA polymerase sliding clamp [Halomarina sp. BCD28]
MFSAITTTKRLASFVDYLSALVDEARIQLTPEGLVATAVDSANVAMVDVRLDASTFESYEADGGRIALNLGRLDDMLSVADNDSLVHLDLNEDTRTLDVRAGRLDYRFALIDPDAVRQEPDFPDIDGTELVADSDDLTMIVKAAKSVNEADRVRLGYRLDEEEFIAIAEGDTDRMHYEIPRDDLVAVSTAADVRSLFSLDYLADVVSPIPSETDVRLTVGDEYPVKLKFHDEDGAHDVQYLVSPRVSS